MKKFYTFIIGLTLALNLCVFSGSVLADPGDIGADPWFHTYLEPDQWEACYQYTGANHDQPYDDTALFTGHTPPFSLTSSLLYVIKNGTPYYTNGYLLDQPSGYYQFVNQTDVRAILPDPDYVLGTGNFATADARQLFNVVSKAAYEFDHFTNRYKFMVATQYGTTGQGLYNPDLTWDIFKTGYLLDATADPSDATKGKMGKIHFPQSVQASPTMIKMYNTKWADELYLLRKIDVRRCDAALVADRTIVQFEVEATTTSFVDDQAYTDNFGKETQPFEVDVLTLGSYTSVRAISLDQFITSYITDAQTSYSYSIVGLDGTTISYSYYQMQHGYYLPDYDLLFYVDANNNPVVASKVNYPVRIELVGTYDDTFDPSDEPAPAYAVIPFP